MTEPTDIAKMSARRKTTPSGLELAARLRDGATVTELATEYDVSKSKIARAVNDAGFSSGDGRSVVQVRTERNRVPVATFKYLGYTTDLDGAACFGEDPKLWFPAPGRNKYLVELEAKRICGTCPVAVACLTRALEEEGDGPRFGIRAGLNENERSALVESGAA